MDSTDVDVVADVRVVADENPTTLGVASNGGMMTDGIVDKFEERAEEGQVLYDATEDRCCCCFYGSR